MGMFDYVRISSERLPLTHAERKILGEWHEWQTKALDCLLHTAEITSEGILRYSADRRGTQWHYLKDEDEVDFYSECNGVWYEFLATFKEGKLTNIERVSPKSYPITPKYKLL